MYLVDANVLLYAVNEDAVHHTAAQEWLDSAFAQSTTVGFSWNVVLAFLRISTHHGVFERPLSPDEAVAEVRTWLSQPSAAVVEPTARHLDVLAGLLLSAGTAGNLVSDAHVAALAIEYAAELISFDADFGRFPGLAWCMPGSKPTRHT